MKKPVIALISYPTWRFFDPEEVYPIGLLTLASVLRTAGWPFEFVNLDSRLASAGSFDSIDKPSLLRDLAVDLAAMKVDVYGFSTINVSYPFTLLLAAEIKRAKPSSQILLGGPQATATAVETMRASPFVDYVLKNEADHSLIALLGALQHDRGYDAVPGLVFRRSGEIAFGVGGHVFVADLDALPLPAYDLVEIPENVAAIKLEAGRGCPFGCRFCTTNVLFSRRFRVKSPRKLVADMEELLTRFGKRRFLLVHDLLVVDRKWMVEFCEELKRSNRLAGCHWSCSARLDLVNEELLSLMASAGCESIYYGVETGSQRLQKIIRKNLKVDGITTGLKLTSQSGIDCTASFIVGFPEETEEDLRMTLDRVVDAQRIPGVTTQLHVLSIYAGTPYWHDYKDRLRFDPDNHPDAGLYPRLAAAEVDLIRAFPEVFSNFYVNADGGKARWVKRMQLVAAFALMVDPLLCVLLKERIGSFVAVVDEWEMQLEHLAHYSEPASLMPVTGDAYQLLVHRYLSFVQNRWGENNPEVRSLVAFNLARIKVMNSQIETAVAPPGRPARLPQVWLLNTEASPYCVRKRLRDGSPRRKDSASCHLLLKKIGPGRIHVFEIQPVAWALLRRCNGSREVDRLATLVSQDLGSRIPVPVIEHGLSSLWEQGFVTFTEGGEA